MPNREKVLVAIVVVESIVLPIVSYWAFWFGYHTAKQLWGLI